MYKNIDKYKIKWQKIPLHQPYQSYIPTAFLNHKLDVEQL